jgi:DeoR/GlpR family transcriptional regulator of sugar metabolism
MSTRKKGRDKMIDTKESNHNGTHPSEEELQDWTLVPDAFAPEDAERIKSHMASCVTCKVYCELVRGAEKDVEAYLQTGTGRNQGQKLLDRIVPEAACGLCAPDYVGPTPTARRDPAQSCPLTAGMAPAPMRLSMYDWRKMHARLEKLAIGKCITNILARGSYPGQAVGVDGGTTNQAFAEVFGFDADKNKRDRRVLKTNHRIVPQLVSRYSNRIQVLGVGGLYRPDRETFVGDQATESIQRLQYEISVLGINGFNPPWLLTTSGVEDGIKKAFIRSSRDLILAFDSSKWGGNSGSKLATLSSLFRPEYLMDPDGRTVHLVTTYPVMDPAVDGTEYAEVLRHREKFLAGVKRLMTNGCREYDSSVRGIVVGFPGAETLDPTFESAEPHQLDDHLSLDYFENLEQDRVKAKNGNSAAQSVLVVSIEFIFRADAVNSRRPVGARRVPTSESFLLDC